jgi:hypothetical protein
MAVPTRRAPPSQQHLVKGRGRTPFITMEPPAPTLEVGAGGFMNTAIRLN